MKTFDVISGRQTGEVIYTITEKLNAPASATFQVLKEKGKVVTHAAIIFKETDPGTYKQSFYTDYFRLPYEPKTSNLGIYEEMMADDYSYRMKLN